MACERWGRLQAPGCTPRRALLPVAMLLYVAGAGLVSLRAAQDATTPPTSLANALPADATGEQIFARACATCHAPDGTGLAAGGGRVRAAACPTATRFPDFTDCADQHRRAAGRLGRGRRARRPGSRRSTATCRRSATRCPTEQIEQVVKYLWTFCTDPSWPRGDLNLPRAFFTEKAFPENETVWTTGVTGAGAKAVTNELVYEHRIGSRGQYEVTVPFDVQQGEAGGAWSRGLGDVELALRRTLLRQPRARQHLRRRRRA